MPEPSSRLAEVFFSKLPSPLQRYRTGDATEILRIPAKAAEVGDLVVYNDGDEYTVAVGSISHRHFECFLSPAETEEDRQGDAAKAAIKWIEEILADQVRFRVQYSSGRVIAGSSWNPSESNGGPWLDTADQAREYFWSGEQPARSPRAEQSVKVAQEEKMTVPPNRAQQMLLEFIREHDAACPVCGYNLKALTRPICPECGQELVLAVGAAQLRFGWLLVSLAPGFFSGIAAFFLLVPIVGVTFFANGRIPLRIVAVDLFGWCSGIFAILLAIKRYRFLVQPRSVQRWWALGIWLIHVAALTLFLLSGFGYL
jgi:hypothetical protein